MAGATEHAAGSGEPSPKGLLGRLYAVWLARLEAWLVVALAVAVLTLGTGLVLDVWDKTSTVQLAMYALTFYLCFVGAVVATRRNGHIAVDAVAPHLPERLRLRLQGALLLGAGAASVWLAAVAHEYVTEIVPASKQFIQGNEGPLWSARVWLWPTVVCCAWMALHFAVGGVIRLAGRTPEALGLVPATPAVDTGTADP